MPDMSRCSVGVVGLLEAPHLVAVLEPEHARQLGLTVSQLAAYVVELGAGHLTIGAHDRGQFVIDPYHEAA